MNRREALLALAWMAGGVPFASSNAAQASGRTYYVSGAGSDTYNGLSAFRPFRTLQRASDLTSPGDVVYVMNGDYRNSWRNSHILHITRSGLPGAYISYLNFPGHRPRIVVGPHNWQGILIHASYIKIRGFELRGGADDISLDYARSQRLNLGNPTTNANGIAADGRNSVTYRNIVLRGNYVHHMPGGGISVNACDHVTIENNTVHSCAWWSPHQCSGISVLGSRDAGLPGTDYKTIVSKNICHSNRNYIGTVDGNRITDGNGIIIDCNKNTQFLGVPAYNGRTLVTNNLCYNNGGTGIHAYNCALVDIINNTAYFNNQTPTLNQGEIIAVACHSTKLFNNILYARSGKICQSNWYNVGVQYNFNIYFNGSVSAMGLNDLVANPRFITASVDPTLANFRLLAGSRAIGTATALLAPDDDIEHQPRPSSVGIDRGAYQR